jgi:hypothetical protein
VRRCRADFVVSSTDNRGLPPEMSNLYCLPGRAGGISQCISLALGLQQRPRFGPAGGLTCNAELCLATDLAALYRSLVACSSRQVVPCSAVFGKSFVILLGCLGRSWETSNCALTSNGSRWRHLGDERWSWQQANW